MKPDSLPLSLASLLASSGPKRAGIQPLQVAQIADALLTLRTASAVAGMSPATLYRRAKCDPQFPKLIRLGTRCTRIRAGDLTAWLASKAEAA